MRRRLLTAAAGVVLAGAVASCSQPVDLAPDAADRLQAAVADVVAAAEAGRYDAAEQAVTRARDLLDDAADHGRLSVARYRVIDQALSRTEAELAAAETAALAAASAASATARPTATADASGTGSAPAEAKPPASKPGPAPAAPGHDKGPGGKGSDGKGDGPGKGHGRG